MWKLFIIIQYYYSLLFIRVLTGFKDLRVGAGELEVQREEPVAHARRAVVGRGGAEAAGRARPERRDDRVPSGWALSRRANFRGLVLGGGGGRPDYLQKLVLGCIEAKFCK